MSVLLSFKSLPTLTRFPVWIHKNKKAKMPKENVTEGEEAGGFRWEDLPFEIIRSIFGKLASKAIFAKSSM